MLNVMAACRQVSGRLYSNKMSRNGQKKCPFPSNLLQSHESAGTGVISSTSLVELNAVHIGKLTVTVVN